MKTKKVGSMGLQVIIVLIVLIGFAMIYFFWLNDVRVAGENLSDYAICKNSNIVNAAKVKIGTEVIAETVGNKCKTEYLEVPKADDPDQEVDFIAKKMSVCWDQYLEGEKTLFLTRDNINCVVCSVLKFEEEKEIKNLNSYLMKNRVPFKKEESYAEYLTGKKIGDGVIPDMISLEETGDLGTLRTETPQAIMFIQGKDVNPNSLIPESSVKTGLFGSLIGGIIGGVLIIGGAIGCPFTGWAGGGTCWAVAIGVGLVAGGTTGYLLGSDSDPNLDSRIFVWPYQDSTMSKLRCTVLEGQDQLDIKKY